MLDQARSEIYRKTEVQKPGYSSLTTTYIPLTPPLSESDTLGTFLELVIEICKSNQPFICPHAAKRCAFLAEQFRNWELTAWSADAHGDVRVSVCNEPLGGFGWLADNWIFSFFETSPLTAQYALDAALMIEKLGQGGTIRSVGQENREYVEIEGLVKNTDRFEFNTDKRFKSFFTTEMGELVVMGKVPAGCRIELNRYGKTDAPIESGTAFEFKVHRCFLSQEWGGGSYAGPYARIRPSLQRGPLLRGDFRLPGTLYPIAPRSIGEPQRGTQAYRFEIPGWWITHELIETDDDRKIVAAPGWALPAAGAGLTLV